MPWYLPMVPLTPKIIIIINCEANQASQPGLKFWGCWIFINKKLKIYAHKKHNMTIPFNYNLFFLIIWACQLSVWFFQPLLWSKSWNLWEPLFTDLGYKGIHSSKYRTEAARLVQPLNSKILCFLWALGQKWAPILWSLKSISSVLKRKGYYQKIRDLDRHLALSRVVDLN